MSDQNPTPAPEGRDQGHPQQQYQVPQYGQQPGYDPQQYQQQYPQQQYDQQPGYDGQQYGQYPPQQYQQYPQYGYQQQWEQPSQSQTLGMVGLGIVAVCAIALAVVSYLIGGHMGQFMLDYGMDVEAMQNPDPNDPMFIALGQQIAGPMNIGFLATLGGIGGWIVSIIATSRRRGRSYGIWGIILGILAPLIGFIAMVVGMWPFVQVLAG